MNRILILGARGKINVEDALKKLREFCKDCQIFDASVICGEQHIKAAYHHAKRAFKYGENISNSLSMEVLLYVAATRQIEDAIKFAGAKNNGKYAFLFIGKKKNEAIKFVEELGLKLDNDLLKASLSKIKKFGITEKELKSVNKSKYADLVLEKMAMLAIKK